MLLAIDIGNTNVVFGVFEGEALRTTFRVEASRQRTSDEYAVLVRQLLVAHAIEPRTISESIIASVVPPLTDVLGNAVREGFARAPLVVGPGIRTGVAILYENPHEVGADRIVNAAAAFERFRNAAIVVDFGTATTFDCISPRGEYLGGVIVPGAQVSLNGLLAHAARLSWVEIAAPPRVVGRNTTHAIQSGIVHGYASLVDGLVRKLVAELGYPCAVIATGGLANLIARFTETIDMVDPDLTLVGLRILHERNRERHA
ncbi:MAG: type III pantothenate kinase [Polyangiaceae bacterium]|nr:type III pantothenate kinase [Polyangiaceae bacterium]